MARWIKWWTTAEQNLVLNDGEPFDRYHAFLWLVESAAPKPTIRKGVSLKRGQVWTTLAFMRDTWHWGSVKKVSNFLNELEANGMVKQKRNKKGTLLTIEKYTFFQGQGNTKETRSASQNAYINKKKEYKSGMEVAKAPPTASELDPRYGLLKEGEADVL